LFAAKSETLKAFLQEGSIMTVACNGIAHIQLSVRDPERCLPFWEKLCHFLEMQTLIKGDDVLYCIGSRTGILVRAAPEDKRDRAFDQDRPGLHHFCFRARSREDVDSIFAFVEAELPEAKIIHGPEEGAHFAPGYYSILFEDPDGIRVEFNFVPGKGHFGDKGRLGSGMGPASRYSNEGLTDS
jgi:catechol 2,3-dioxygenase-like lactoylglutathione lyase family enzyme